MSEEYKISIKSQEEKLNLLQNNCTAVDRDINSIEGEISQLLTKKGQYQAEGEVNLQTFFFDC